MKFNIVYYRGYERTIFKAHLPTLSGEFEIRQVNSTGSDKKENFKYSLKSIYSMITLMF